MSTRYHYDMRSGMYEARMECEYDPITLEELVPQPKTRNPLAMWKNVSGRHGKGSPSSGFHAKPR